MTVRTHLHALERKGMLTRGYYEARGTKLTECGIGFVNGVVERI